MACGRSGEKIGSRRAWEKASCSDARRASEVRTNDSIESGELQVAQLGKTSIWKLLSALLHRFETPATEKGSYYYSYEDR